MRFKRKDFQIRHFLLLPCGGAVIRPSGTRPMMRPNAPLTKAPSVGGTLADNDVTHSPKKSTRRKTVRGRQVVNFPQVKGRIIERVELSISADDYSIDICFQDKTALHFDIDIERCISVTPDYADWKTGNWRSLKRWKPIHSKRFTP
jgi:hypothetical protein